MKRLIADLEDLAGQDIVLARGPVRQGAEPQGLLLALARRIGALMGLRRKGDSRPSGAAVAKDMCGRC